MYSSSVIFNGTSYTKVQLCLTVQVVSKFSYIQCKLNSTLVVFKYSYIQLYNEYSSLVIFHISYIHVQSYIQWFYKCLIVLVSGLFILVADQKRAKK